MLSLDRNHPSTFSPQHLGALGLVSLSLILGACDPTIERPEIEPVGAATDGMDAPDEPPAGSTSAGEPDGDGSDGADDPEPGSTGADEPPPADDGDGTTGGEMQPTDCTAPQPLPAAPPIDCSGATGVLSGSAIIEDGGDTPSILAGIRRVEGSVRINRLTVADLDFMACLQEVTGDVTIYGNDQLVNVDGLWNLQLVGTDFVLSENDALVDFDGLPNLATIGRNLIIKNNEALERISGFHTLVEIGNNFFVQSNGSLTDIDGVGGLEEVGGVFAVTANPSLCISSVDCVGSGILVPAVPPDDWSTQANDNGC